MIIQIDPHTLERAVERGTTEEEIREVVASGFEIPAKQNRMGRAKIFPFLRERNKAFYEQKRVEVFYTMEKDTIVTVTVYVFYGKWS